MNGNWIEIFRSGQQTDSNGTTRTWSNTDLDHAVESFDASKHEPPVVVGHPANNKPAYGWVDGLKRVGNVLMAKLKQVEPAFSKLVEEGRFKKRSVSFYPDGSVRHIGFLGAAAPAVKGLKDIQFEEDIAYFEYEDEPTTPTYTPSQEEEDMTLEEALRENERLKGQVKTLESEVKTAEDGKAEFAEKAKEAEDRAGKAEKDLKDLQESNAKAAEDQVNKEITDFVDGLVKEGKIAPADKARNISALEGAAKAQKFEFAEDGGDTFGALKSALEALPVKEELQDFSAQYPFGDGDGEPVLDADSMLDKV